MSRFLEIQPKLAISIGVSVLVGAGIAYWSVKWIKDFYNNKIPTKWVKVGQISEIFCFPIKSCGPVALREIECGLLGSYSGLLRDRVFMVIRPDGECITARTYPKMVLIKPTIVGDIINISAPGMQEIEINIRDLYSMENNKKVKVFQDVTDCVDCGDTAAEWLSNYIFGESIGCRLVFYKSSEPKSIIEDKNYLYKQADRKDTGALHDETSFMLMNQSSFDDLNSRLDEAVTPLQYRPNFVVKGPKAWSEDLWQWVKIGENTVFRNVQPCTRCVFTNINPTSGVRNAKMEPLKTLKSFRTFADVSTSPWFGIHLGIRNNGKVKLGDDVYVEA